jgi:LuxR family maltose regulon positive regulatory protein
MTILLATKLHQPSPPPKRVARPQLIQRLDEGLAAGRQITLVSAPAGFGKTTCVSEWLQTLQHWPVAWLSLDPADDDPGRFFTYLLAALQKVDQNLGVEVAGVLSAGQLPPAEILSTILINDILDLNQPFLLVLDDFQVIQDNFILQIIEALVDHLPNVLYLVLVTREDPSLPLARLRANNQLSEIRAADLRFSAPEAEQFLNQILGLSLPFQDIQSLVNRTEGWIAGLHLAGLSMRERVDPSNFIENLSGRQRFILNYLVEEVLNQQPPEIQRFLLQTSILDKLSGDLCNQVTGREDSHAMLEQLFNANLFLDSLDEEGRWYRYHQLFADLLRDRQERLLAEDTAELHRRASRWYAGNGRISEAIQHALAARDYEVAVQWIEKHAMDMLMQWHVKTVEGWMQSIPTDWVAQSPRANLAFAWMHLMRANHEQASPFLERLQTLFADPQRRDQIAHEDPALVAKWLSLQAMLLNAQGKPLESLNLSQRALEIAPAEDSQTQGMIYPTLANAYQQVNDYDNALEAFQALIQLGRREVNSVLELVGISGLALLALQHGQYHFAFEIASQGLERVERTRSLPPISTALFGELAVIHYQWYQLEQAHDYFQRAIQISTLSGYSDAELFYGVILSRLFQIQGDLGTAAEKIQKAVEMMHVQAPATVRDEVIAQQIRICLAQEDLPAAERILTETGFSLQDAIASTSLESAHHAPMLSGEEALDTVWPLYVSALRILLYRAKTHGELAQARASIELANRLIDNAIQHDYLPLVLEMLLLRAQMHAVLDDRQASQADYLQALELGQPEGFISIFLEEGPPLAAALAGLLEQDQLRKVSPTYARKILAAFPGDVESKTVLDNGATTANEALPEPLTKRELEVLHLIRDGLSNQEIAERLVVTLHTVKKHSSNIYAKLGVSSRTQAIARARQLKLI